MTQNMENAIVIDELEEAKFIQQWLREKADIDVDLDLIFLITEAQMAHMEKIGLIEYIDEK